jgi:hypothetical protein
MANLSVKIPTAEVIKLLNNKIAELNKAIEAYPVELEKFEKANAKYNEDLLKVVVKNIKTATDQSARIYSTSTLKSTLTLSLSLPRSVELPQAPIYPKDPNTKVWVRRDYATPLERLEQTLKVLTLTTQETVNASTYNNIISLL